MSVKIIADLITENGIHTITLPQSQKMFDKNLNAIKIHTGDVSKYEISRVLSGFDALDKHLEYAKNIEELNFLAQLLDEFSEAELLEYENFMTACLGGMTMQYLINAAYNFHGYGQESYDGQSFPKYDYKSRYFMRVKLSPHNHKTGIYVFLPVRQSVINRALYRLGASSVNECGIKKRKPIPVRPEVKYQS